MGSDEVRRLAVRVQQIGDDVRRLADQTLAAGTAAWRSAAAASFRHRLAEEATRIRAVAADLDRAAEALQHHAVAVDGSFARIDRGGWR
jgi:hypothetical protein